MKRLGISRKVDRKMTGTALRAGAALLLSLFLCFAMEYAASAKGKAYVAVFYRTFKDEEDPEAADVRAALSEALEDAGIAYREYDGEDDPLIQLMQIVQEKDAMLLIVNPAEQSFGDAGEKTEEKAGEKTEKQTEKNAAADIIVQTDGRPLIFFDCEISEKTAEMTEELCVLVNAEEPEVKTVTEESEIKMVTTESEIKTVTAEPDVKIAAGETKQKATVEQTEHEMQESEKESAVEERVETEITGAETRIEIETETETENETEAETEFMPPEKNIQGMADVIAIIAGNYMTGAGFFEGIEEDWITDEWRVDVPCRFLT